MDGRVKEELEHLNRKLEATVEIIMEHLKDSEERLQAMEEFVYALKKDGSE